MNGCQPYIDGSALVFLIENELKVLEEERIYRSITAEYVSILASRYMKDPSLRVSFEKEYRYIWGMETRPLPDSRTRDEIINDTLTRMNLTNLDESEVSANGRDDPCRAADT